jgi:methionyl-tRNA synthetase
MINLDEDCLDCGNRRKPNHFKKAVEELKAKIAKQEQEVLGNIKEIEEDLDELVKGIEKAIKPKKK